MMTEQYEIQILASLAATLLRPFLAEIGVAVAAERINAGWAFVQVECDAVTAGLIRARFFIEPISG